MNTVRKAIEDEEDEKIRKSEYTQSDVQGKLDIFMESLEDEKLTDFIGSGGLSGGLCSAFSFMQFLDKLFDLKDKHLNRMQELVNKDDDVLQEMANTYTEFKKQRHELIELNNKKILDPDIIKVIPLNTQINKLSQICSTLQKKEEKMRSDNEKIVLKKNEEFLRMLRDKREKLIEKILKKRFRKDQWRHVINAKDLYLYIHTLVAVFNPSDRLAFSIGGQYIYQWDYDKILEKLQLQPLSDTKVEVQKKSISATKVFEIAFTFSASELASVLKEVTRRGDLIRLGSPDHAMFLYVSKDGTFELFNPGRFRLETPEKLAKQIMEHFSNLNDKQTFSPIGISVFTKTGADIEPRPHRTTIIEQILKSRKIGKKDHNDHDAIMGKSVFMAVKYGHADVIQQLSEAKADLDIVDGAGRSPAIIAATYGEEGVIKVLAEAKANLDAKDRAGMTPAIRAAYFGYANFIKTLVELKSDPNISFNIKSSVLLAEGSRTRKLQLLQALLNNHGIKLESSLIFTPLHTAAFFGHAEVVKILLDKGMILSEEAGEISALDFAKAMGHDNIVKIIQLNQELNALEKKADLNSPKWFAIQRLQRLLIHAGGDAKKLDNCEEEIKLFLKLDNLVSYSKIYEEYNSTNSKEERNELVEKLIGRAYRTSFFYFYSTPAPEQPAVPNPKKDKP